jgi:hypothetical protein
MLSSTWVGVSPADPVESISATGSSAPKRRGTSSARDRILKRHMASSSQEEPRTALEPPSRCADRRPYLLAIPADSDSPCKRKGAIHQRVFRRPSARNIRSVQPPRWLCRIRAGLGLRSESTRAEGRRTVRWRERGLPRWRRLLLRQSLRPCRRRRGFPADGAPA